MNARPLRQLLLWGLGGVVSIWAPAELAAQTLSIAAGQTIQGRLESSDPALADGSHYDLFLYEGSPGDRITVTMRSTAFDAYLSGGNLQGGTFDQVDRDDDGGGGTDARLVVTVGPTGTYAIRANSLGARETGAYSLTVERQGGPVTAGGGVTPIAANQTVSGRLDTSDPRLSDDSYYDLYLYQGRPGEEIVITMRSSDFDTYLAGGVMTGGEFSYEDSDDDGAGGTDSRLTVTLGSTGSYAIRANSLSASQTGNYTLQVQSSSTSSAGSNRTIQSGQTLAGRLESSDPRLLDDSYYHQYLYEGRAGERIIVTLTSSDFDAYLRWGRISGGEFEFLQSDDDGDGGTNARLVVTLPSAGTYAFQANSYGANETGRYVLSVESAGGPAGLPMISLGQSVSGRLEATDPVLSDNSHYKLYALQGRPGDQVLVTMRSPDFDAYLSVGQMVGAAFEATQRDDDSAGGTDAQILATIGADGMLAIQANSLSARQTGRFTLTVEAASGSSPTAPTPAGRVTIAPGQRINGALRRSDPMLADSSFYNLYVYAGNPGDRLRITLTSGDFDTYLRWGRIEGDDFRLDSYDDDGAGGTDAQLEVTVGGTGVYALQANSYSPGETGAYTLSIERIATSAAPVSAPMPSAGSSSGSAGKWRYLYADNASPVYRSLGQQMKQVRVLEDISENLNARYALPRHVDIRLDECDMVNAYFSPRNTEIVFCYELLEMLSDLFASGERWTQEEQDAIDGAFRFIMMHEVGHALVHVLDLPITGREEDAADQLAVVTLVEQGGEKGAQAALNGVLALQPESNVFDDYEFADEHSLGPVRLYNVLCWIYGSNPSKYTNIVNSGSLPEDRAVRCPGEWERMSKAWQRILQPYSTQ